MCGRCSLRAYVVCDLIVKSIVEGMAVMREEEEKRVRKLEMDNARYEQKSSGDEGRMEAMREEIERMKRDCARVQADCRERIEVAEKVSRERDGKVKELERLLEENGEKDRTISKFFKMSEMKDKTFLKKMNEMREEVELQMV